MNLPALVLAAAACCVALGACRGDQAAESVAPKAAATAPSDVQPAGTYTVRHRMHPSLPEFAFTLIGDKPGSTNDAVRVQRIEIRSGTTSEPFQVIEGLDTETPVTAATPAFDVVDMNFDGYGDFRLVESRAAGPNTPYLNWLFDPALRKFVESRELNEIPAAQFDAGTREIRSDWRDGATRYGTDIYVYVEGRPVVVRKEEKTYQAPGVYTLKKSQLVGGVWKTVEEREVREAKGG